MKLPWLRSAKHRHKTRILSLVADFLIRTDNVNCNLAVLRIESDVLKVVDDDTGQPYWALGHIRLHGFLDAYESVKGILPPEAKEIALALRATARRHICQVANEEESWNLTRRFFYDQYPLLKKMCDLHCSQ